MDSRFIDVKVKGDSMWPTLRDGDVVRFEKVKLPIGLTSSKLIEPNQIVLFKHPYKKNFNLIKRIQLLQDGWVFLIGDNPDPNASEDSHNFGLVHQSYILATLTE